MCKKRQGRLTEPLYHTELNPTEPVTYFSNEKYSRIMVLQLTSNNGILPRFSISYPEYLTI
ncbi:MAG: hypothetical protein M3Q77_06580 [Thermoproteota archaeon]|nr:hypothetical protein [Thermoproteota archaeon]